MMQQSEQFDKQKENQGEQNREVAPWTEIYPSAKSKGLAERLEHKFNSHAPSVTPFQKAQP